MARPRSMHTLHQRSRGRRFTRHYWYVDAPGADCVYLPASVTSTTLASVYLPASIAPTTLANCGAVSSYQHARTATTSTTPTLQAAVSYAPTASGAPSAGLALRCALDPTRRAGNTTTAHRGGGRPIYGICRVGGGWSGAHARDHCTSTAGQTANTAPPARCSTDAVDVPAAGDGCGSRREVGRGREGGGVQRYTERGR